MHVLFLDIDGVLNRHRKHPRSPFCGIEPACMAWLNHVLHMTGCSVVLSSAWRYQDICGSMTLRGLEFLLYSHGLIPRHSGAPWLIGRTPPDELIGGQTLDGRVLQIRASLYSLLPNAAQRWAVVDDLPLDFGFDAGRFVRTVADAGLTEIEAGRLVELLN